MGRHRDKRVWKSGDGLNKKIEYRVINKKISIECARILECILHQHSAAVVISERTGTSQKRVQKRPLHQEEGTTAIMIHALTFAFISVLRITIGIAIRGLEIRLLVLYISASNGEDD